MKTIYITEEQKGVIMDEMAYPASFNFEEFSKCTSFKSRVDYCERNLTRIASGSSRIVYQVDDDKVLKLAKNTKGIQQNNVEIDLGTSSYFYCFAEVYEYDDDGLWLEMQKARSARKADFKSILGIPFEAVQYFVDYQHSGYSAPPRWGFRFDHSEYKDEIEDILDSEEGPAYEFLKDIGDYMGSYKLQAIGDLKRISSYGIVDYDGSPSLVLIDYGLNDDIYNSYYKKW